MEFPTDHQRLGAVSKNTTTQTSYCTKRAARPSNSKFRNLTLWITDSLTPQTRQPPLPCKKPVQNVFWPG